MHRATYEDAVQLCANEVRQFEILSGVCADKAKGRSVRQIRAAADGLLISEARVSAMVDLVALIYGIERDDVARDVDKWISGDARLGHPL